MTFSIRTMTAQDISALERIQEEAYGAYFLEPADVIAARLHASPHTAWVAEKGGEVCAYLVGYLSEREKITKLHEPFTNAPDANCLYLHDLALSPSAQGQGIARGLIETAEKFARGKNLNALALLSVQNSKEFWQKFGFEEYFDLDEAAHANLATYLTDGQDAYYMVKVFEG